MRATWMGKPERLRLREEAESSGATWTRSPKDVFEGRKYHKPRHVTASFSFTSSFIILPSSLQRSGLPLRSSIELDCFIAPT